MKKLSLFLSALLISMMSFAAEYSATNTSNVSFTIGNKAYDNKIKIEGTEYQAIKLGTSSVVGDMSFTIPANTAKIHLHIVGWSGKSSAVTISASNGVTLGTTEITATSDAGMTGNSPFTLSDVSKVTTDYYHVIELSSPTTAETTITMTSVSGKYRVVIWGVNTEEATSGEQGETVDAPTFSATEANFTEAFNLTITSAEGTTLKYTTDKTDPTTSETAVVVESNTATVAIPAKSTMVKAVAVKGELVSNVKSMTFCYVNSEATAYTVTEALAIYNEGLGLSNKLYIKGSVKNIEDLSTEYGNATYTITDGDNDLYIYRGKNFGGEKFTSVDQLFVGDDLVLYGQLTSYNGNPQVAANNEIISRESKTKSIVAEDLTFEAIAKGAEVKAQTLTVIGANLTAEITATLDNENFTVTPATLPAAGGDLTITPAADLAAGEHTATLTLTSGDVTKEVALSILVKDVYAIEWYVNGKLYEETTVIEGAALALPEAPEAPEACSEKVFVGWTAAEEVNADGSEIEWATVATVPTTDATYYAVFAVQEGEGGAAEEGTVTLAYTGTTTGNMDLEANNAAAVGLDATKWNVIATKGDNSNAPGLNKSGDIRIYYGDPTSNTITVTSLDETVTISTIVITYTGDSYSNGKILVNDDVVTGTNGTYEINANSFTITNGNTSNVQVRFKNIVINYTAGAAATYTDYSTTCEAEIEWMPMELEITNLTTEVMEVEGVKYLQLMGRDDMNDADVVLFLNNYADVDDDYEVNTESSYMTFGGMEMTVLEGMMTQTSETDKGTIYEGIVRTSVEEEGEIMYVEFALTMYAAPATVLELTDAIVAINEELGTLTFNVPTGEGEGYYAELAGYTAPGVHEGPQICLFETPEIVAYANYVETSVADGVITLKGEFTSFMGPKFDLTISGKLPVVEPEGITYELNGGELPAVVVPTNAELWEAFKPYYNEYYGLTRADQPIDKVSTFAAAKMQEIMTDEASEYKWLGDYVQSVATAAGVPLSTDMASANEGGWRWAVHAFFNAAAGQYGAAGIDFTEAGKPEAWGAAYEAEYGVVLPTEPVEEDYVLPTPTKTGYDFVGWYDNAEGTGEAMTVLPAGWVGTLYAIWKESSTTGVDNNIIAEQAVKVLRNGQVLIMIGEKTFNIMGQQVK